jgi:immune inhibitor A
MWCGCTSCGLCFVPPAPEVMAKLFAEYLQRGKPLGLSFKEYLAVIGFINVAEGRTGMDDGTILRAERRAAEGPQLIRVPSHAITGALRVKVLLVDFSDRPGTLPASHYEAMLFSKGTFPTGSMRDFYHEVSLGKVDVSGTVHGWIRMPRAYIDYTNGRSGTGLTYPRNAQGMAEHAVQAALAAGVVFEPQLDALGQHTVTALFIVHAGVGAESQQDPQARADNIWSHKWTMRNPVDVGDGLQASVYLTVPNDAKVGVCAHELGHLAFQWEDFYDPNYDEDGTEWDGSGRWDLMAGGSWNGNGACPAHPAGLHKLQHGWVAADEVRAGTSITLDPYTRTAGRVVKIFSPQYRPGQYLLVENRRKSGFDAQLPGEGLLVWRVDEAQEMFKPDRPALLLLQADGRHDLERADDWNEGDAGDPFPGSAGRDGLDDQGDLSTSFPGGSSSGVRLSGITRDAATGRVSFDVAFGGNPPPGGTIRVVEKSIAPEMVIPDARPAGIASSIALDADGAAREIAVDVTIVHPYVSDLRLELVAPSGMAAVLHDGEGADSDDIRAIYRSSELPALRTLVGEPVRGSWQLRVADLVTADVGVLHRWGIAIALDEDSPRIEERRTPGVAIPDNTPAGVADVISVSRAGTARSVALELDVSHPYVQDLRVELIAPDGTRALVQERTGGSGDDIRRTFSTADTPALAALIGRDVRGPWTVRVSDLAGRDVGVLNAWGLVIDLSRPARVVQKEAAPGLEIPDNTPAGIGTALKFGEAGTVQAIQVRAIIEHSYIGDLRVELVAPSGRASVLHDRAGGRTRNLTLDLSSGSDAALARLVGQPSAGTWILRIADLEAADVGILRSWSLGLTYV